MTALPYYKWHWQRWRANRRVQRLGLAERGAYRELLDECWAEGFIPDDISLLADICGCPEAEMIQIWRVIRDRFYEIEPGKMTNHTLEEQRTATDSVRAANARNGKAGAKAKLAGASDREATAERASGERHIEEKRRVEKSREEDTPFQPTISDQARAAARLVMQEAPLAGFKVEMALETAARHELSSGGALEAVGEALLKAWREYTLARSKLEFTWGAEKFFGEGNWKDQAAWPWRDDGTNRGSTQAQRVSPATARGLESRKNIQDAAARRYGASVVNDAGADPGAVPKPDPARGGAGHVPRGVGGDGPEVRDGNVSGRIVEGHF